MWGEEEDSDKRAFFKLEKEICKEMFPPSAEIFEAEEDEEVVIEEEGDRGVGSAIMLNNSDGNNDNEDGGGDKLVKLDET